MVMKGLENKIPSLQSLLFRTYVGLEQGSKKRSSVVAALPGRKLKCSNFPRRKKGKRKRNGWKGKRKETKEGRKGRERRERLRDRMGWYIGKEEESVYKEMEVFGLLPGRKIFFGPRFRATNQINP